VLEMRRMEGRITASDNFISRFKRLIKLISGKLIT